MTDRSVEDQTNAEAAILLKQQKERVKRAAEVRRVLHAAEENQTKKKTSPLPPQEAEKIQLEETNPVYPKFPFSDPQPRSEAGQKLRRIETGQLELPKVPGKQTRTDKLHTAPLVAPARKGEWHDYLDQVARTGASQGGPKK